MAWYRDYSMSTDFPMRCCDGAVFTWEVRDDPAITTAMQSPYCECDFDLDRMRIWFKVEPDAGEITALDALVANHLGYEVLAHGARHEKDGTDEVPVESMVTAGDAGQVAVAQVDGSLSMEDQSGGNDAEAETLTYTDTTNKVAGPLSATPVDVTQVNLWTFEGPAQKYVQDYTVREVIGGSAPGWYVCVATDSSAPGGGAFNGGSNPGTGIDAVLASGDAVRVTYSS